MMENRLREQEDFGNGIDELLNKTQMIEDCQKSSKEIQSKLNFISKLINIININNKKKEIMTVKKLHDFLDKIKELKDHQSHFGQRHGRSHGFFSP